MPLEQLQSWITQYGSAAIFCLLALGIVGIPIPDETLLTLTGFLIFKGTLHPAPAYLSSLAGTAIGISISYAIGKYGGTRVIRRFGQRLHITDDRLRRVETWFQRRGKWVLVIGYFVPGIRHVTAIVVGSSGVRFGSFARFALAGAVLWSACFVGAGYILGEEWNAFAQLARPIALAIGALAVFSVVVYILFRHRSAR